jgi:hypothetical protein
MYKNIIPTLIVIVFSIIGNNLYGQIECSPYHKVKNYTVDDKGNYGFSYVTCFHAQGVVVDLSYKSIMIGTHMMDKGHMNTVYGFISYRYFINKKTIAHIGPLYKINNNSGLLIGQFGLDRKLYGPLYLTSRILQVKTNLNYLNVGLKITL